MKNGKSSDHRENFTLDGETYFVDDLTDDEKILYYHLQEVAAQRHQHQRAVVQSDAAFSVFAAKLKASLTDSEASTEATDGDSRGATIGVTQ